MNLDCFGCDVALEADTSEGLVEGFLAHARTQHDWDYPDQSLRNYALNVAEATQRLTGPAERLDTIGPIEVREMNADRIDDWLGFFDHDAFVGKPDWAACYCLEPHVPFEGEPHWTENRSAMVTRLTGGETQGYLAYVEGRPAGWVNASRRSDYGLYTDVDPDGPGAEQVVGVSCFIVAPPYRQHGVADALLDRVIADAPARGADWVEAYPRPETAAGDSGNFRGPITMFSARGFQPVETHEHYTVMRRPARDSAPA